MVKNIFDTLMNKFEPRNLSVQFPYAFEQLKGTDAEFEMVTSNTIQPLRLLYQHDIAEKKIAAIFVNTHVKQLEWTQAGDKGIEVTKLFRETFEFKEDEVEIYIDLDKQ